MKDIDKVIQEGEALLKHYEDTKDSVLNKNINFKFVIL